MKNNKKKSNKHIFLAGLFAYFSIVVSALMSVGVIILLIYSCYLFRKKVFHFVLGGFVGFLPMLFYNFIIFNTPFTLSRHHLDPMLWDKVGGIYGLQLPNPFIFLRLLIYPERGLFFYYPILVVSLVGLYHLYKKFRAECMVVVSMFLSFLLINSSWWAWWGSISFGPRHLMPLMPFLILPLSFVLENVFKCKTLKILLLILISISILNNFSGTQPLIDELAGPEKIYMASTYQSKVNSFEILRNPLDEHYFPLFLKYGPRSLILENIVDGYTDIDIREVPLSRDWKFPFVAHNHLYFLPLLVIGIFILFIWLNEITDFIKENKKNN
jgi:hypothetical protein